MKTTSPLSQNRLLSSISMAVFATVGAMALTASTSSPAFAVANEDNTDNGTGGVMGSADTIKWTAPAAGTDENWTVADGVNIGTGGAVVIASDTDGVGALTFAGDSTATGTIGDTTHRIGLITTSGASGKTVTITGVGFADDINIDGTGTLALQSSFTLDNDINFGADGVLSLSDGVNVTSGGAAAISNTTTNNGTLNIAGDTTITGTTGSTGAGLKAINVNGGSTKTATFSDDVKATTITLATGSKAVFNNGANVTATTIANAATGSGILTFKGGTVAAAIGNTGTGFATVNVGTDADVSLTGDILAVDTKFAADNKLVLADGGDISGTVTTAGAGTGTLEIDGDTTVSGAAGVTGTRLKLIDFDGGSGKTATFASTIFALDMNVDGAGTLALQGDATVTNDVNFGADGAITLTDGTDITSAGAAAITNTTTNHGTLTIAGTSTITGTTGSTGAGLKAINVNGGSTKTTTFTDDVKATTITLATGGNAVFNSGADVTATTIANSTTNSGVLTFKGGTVAVTTIGNTGVGFNQINVAESANVTLNATTKATTVNIAGNNTLTLSDTKSIQGAITTALDGTGKFTFANEGNVTGNIGASGTELHTITLGGTGGVASIFGGNVYVDTFTAAGAVTAVDLADNKTFNITNAVAAAAAGAAGTSYNFDITRAASTGLGTQSQIVMGSGAGFDATNITFDVTMGSNLLFNNSAITLIDGQATSVLPGTLTVTDNTTKGSFALSRANSNQDIVATFTRGDSYKWANRATGANVALATMLDTIGQDADFTALQVALDADAPTNPTHNVDAILSTVLADVNVTPQEAMMGHAGVVDNRLAAVRGAATGMASGDANGGRGIWVQAFGATEEQDSSGTFTGYDADTMGVAVGFDKRVRPNTVLGVTAGYAQTDSDRKGTTGDIEITGYQAGLYGSYERGKMILSGLLSAAYNQYDSARYITALGVNAKGDYDGYSYLARAKADYVVPVKGGFDITPNVSLTYVGNNTDTYTETGAGGLNMTVDNDNVNSVLGRVGVDFGHTYKSATKYVRPELRVGYIYDFVGDEQSATSTFSGGGSSFVTRGVDPKQGSLTAGAGLELVSAGGFFADANYDYTHRSDYSAHAGMLRVGMRY